MIEVIFSPHLPRLSCMYTCTMFCISNRDFWFFLLLFLVRDFWTLVTSGIRIKLSSPVAIFTNKFKSLVN